MPVQCGKLSRTTYLGWTVTKAITCLAGDVEVSIEAALLSRSEAKAQRRSMPTFLCVECGEVVDPHSEGVGSPAHFEHRARNQHCSLSVPATGRTQKRSAVRPSSWITTAELAKRTAGSDDYIRTKGGEVKGLALNPRLNHDAPNIVVVGKGQRIEARAKLFLESGLTVPTYMKRGTNAWELIGTYRAIEYKTEVATIRKHRGSRPLDEVAGILFLERIDEVTVDVRGGGFADSKTRKAVEQAAIAFVTTQYESQLYKVESRESQNLGYDLWAFKPGSTLYLEVKGTDSPNPRFFLTRNERRFAAQEADWRLVMVTSARTSPQSQVLTMEEVRCTFNLDPLAWECTPLA
jgi:hypothetical protein